MPGPLYSSKGNAVRILVSGSTRTVASLAATWPDHLRHPGTPKNRNSSGSLLATGLSWAVDNGAYAGFDAEGFRKLVRRVAGKPRLLWVVCPDVVADARATLEQWRQWEPELRTAGVPVAFVLQDGQENEQLPDADAYFIGGSTRFKLSESAAALGSEAKRRGAWLHMGRCNTLRRLRTAFDTGCDSVDGSSMSMYGDKYIHKFCAWLRQLENQGTLWGANHEG